jgi:hypothetical protein
MVLLTERERQDTSDEKGKRMRRREGHGRIRRLGQME